MPQNYTASHQVHFLTEWFNSWSELKKEDFLPILAQMLKPEDHVNGLLGGLSSLSVSGRRPSLFDCQIKLFHEWFIGWSDGEQNEFLEHVKTTDPEFMQKLDKSLKGELPDNDTESEEQSSETQSSSFVSSLSSTESSRAESVTVGSPSMASSPLSSLSHSHSPNDSGVDETQVEPVALSTGNNRTSVANRGPITEGLVTVVNVRSGEDCREKGEVSIVQSEAALFVPSANHVGLVNGSEPKN